MNDDEPPQQRASRKKTRNVRLSAPGTHTAASAAGIASKTPSTSKPKKYSQPSIFSSCKKMNVNNNVGAPTKSKSVYNPLPHSKGRLIRSPESEESDDESEEEADEEESHDPPASPQSLNDGDSDSSSSDDSDVELVSASKNSSGAKKRKKQGQGKKTPPKKKKSKKSSYRPKRPAVVHVTDRAKSFCVGAKSISSMSQVEKEGEGEEGEDEQQYLQPGENAWKNYHLQKKCGASSKWWSYYLVYHNIKHKDMECMAKCRIPGCNTNINYKNGTSGLSGHIRNQHTTLWDENQGLSSSAATAATIPPASADPGSSKKQSSIKKHTRRVFTMDAKKRRYLAAATFWAIDQDQTFTTFGKPSFRGMLGTLSDEAEEIAKCANEKSIRENVRQYGILAKNATKLEMKKHKGSITTDHWTGPDGQSYTVTTFHYIEDHEMKSLVIDFKVFKGSTTGERIWNDQKKVIDVTEDVIVVMAVTDTTGNMGSLGQKLREAGFEHGYCIDHNVQRTAVLAFDGKCSIIVTLT